MNQLLGQPSQVHLLQSGGHGRLNLVITLQINYMELSLANGQFEDWVGDLFQNPLRSMAQECLLEGTGI